MASVRIGIMEICYLNFFGTLFPCLIPHPGLLFTGYFRVNPPGGNKRLCIATPSPSMGGQIDKNLDWRNERRTRL